MDKIIRIAFIFLIVFSFSLPIAVPVSAAIECNSEKNANDIYDDIISFHLNDNGINSHQEWINKILTEEIGINGEWYVISLSQIKKYDFSVFENELLKYLDENIISSASTRLKFALTLAACGSKSAKIEEMLNSSMGKQGIMSLVYGIHLLNNGYSHNAYDINSASQELITMQNSDGGWALYGNRSDVDVTAMCLQALAPLYNKFTKEIELALNFLSQKQLSDGDYLSYGVSNPESGAQVIVALSSLKINFFQDDRFIKNGNTLLDGICKYKLSDGSFSHVQNGETNGNATVQVFCAMASYLRMKDGKEGFYDLDSVDKYINEISSENPSEQSLDISSDWEQENLSEKNADQNQNSHNQDNIPEKSTKIKYILCIVILSLFLIIISLMVILKKFNRINFIVLLIITVILTCIVLMLDIKLPDEYYNGGSISKDAVGRVTMSINCNNIVKMASDNSNIPLDGVVLPETEFYISKGETAFDILIEASRKYSIQLENNGTEKSAYIAGINYIYEFDFGDTSGWVFLVNGVHASVGCSSYILKDGDVIEWRYVLEPWENLE